MPSIKVVAGAAAVVALFVGVPGGASASTATRVVVLKNISFSPKKLSIAKGTKVMFSWQDGDTPHNVTSKGKLKFKRASTRTTGTYTVKFAKAGTYNYVCTIHPGMAGRIVVH